jgi:DNA-binding protein YbaB
MFDKMKQMYELQKKAKELQKKLEGIKIEQSEGGVKLVINGIFKVESLDIDASLLSPELKGKLETILRKLFTEAVQEAQKRSAVQSQELLKGLAL